MSKTRIGDIVLFVANGNERQMYGHLRRDLVPPYSPAIVLNVRQSDKVHDGHRWDEVILKPLQVFEGEGSRLFQGRWIPFVKDAIPGDPYWTMTHAFDDEPYKPMANG